MFSVFSCYLKHLEYVPLSVSPEHCNNRTDLVNIIFVSYVKDRICHFNGRLSSPQQQPTSFVADHLVLLKNHTELVCMSFKDLHLSFTSQQFNIESFGQNFLEISEVENLNLNQLNVCCGRALNKVSTAIAG